MNEMKCSARTKSKGKPINVMERVQKNEQGTWYRVRYRKSLFIIDFRKCYFLLFFFGNVLAAFLIFLVGVQAFLEFAGPAPDPFHQLGNLLAAEKQ